jgi:hypothetical protein
VESDADARLGDGSYSVKYFSRGSHLSTDQFGEQVVCYFIWAGWQIWADRFAGNHGSVEAVC